MMIYKKLFMSWKTLLKEVNMQHIYSTQEILKDLNQHIVKQESWSLVRLGDAGTGIVSAFRAPDVVDRGKWKMPRGLKKANLILGQLTIPMIDREKIIDRVIVSLCNSNYMDHYDSFIGLPTQKGVGVLGEKQDEIYSVAGINNGENFCSPFVHYFSIVDGEYNLFNIMKGRRIFCITSQNRVIKKLERTSGAETIHSYRIPRRGRKAQHYINHFDKVCSIIKNRAKKYDLFLIGAGLLAVVYAGFVKENGGRAFDCGRLFDFWSGVRNIDSRPKRFIQYDSSKLLCRRIRKPKGIFENVW